MIDLPSIENLIIIVKKEFVSHHTTKVRMCYTVFYFTYIINMCI